MSVLEQTRADQAASASVVVPGARGAAGPGVVAFGDRLYVAWGDASTFALYASSAPIGGPFSTPARVTLPGSTAEYKTDGAVALTVFDGRLAIGWNGRSARNQLLGFLEVADGEIVLAESPVSFGMSDRGPALEPFGGVLALAYKSTEDGSGSEDDDAAPLYVRFSADGRTFEPAVPVIVDGVGVVSRWRPALAVLNERLYLAWTGKSDKFVNVASSVDGRTWEREKTLADAQAAFGPGLGTVGQRLTVVWTDPDEHVAARGSRDGERWSPPRILDGAASTHAPEVAASRLGRLFAWTDPAGAVHVGYGRDLPEPPEG